MLVLTIPVVAMAGYADDTKSKWRGRGHFFMLTTFTHDKYRMADSTVRLRDNINYAGRLNFETAPTTGRAHTHVFMYSRNKKTWAAAKDWLYEFSGCRDGAVVELKTLAHGKPLYALHACAARWNHLPTHNLLVYSACW